MQVRMALTPNSLARRKPAGADRSGGKRRSGKPTRGNRWLGEVLIQCARAAARSRETYLSAPVLAAGPPHRQEEGRGRRGALNPGDRLAPANRGLRLPGPGWRLLRAA
jgi:hypothetical protein